eukprot:10081344-Alexandrium_andersonii.AAC.1
MAKLRARNGELRPDWRLATAVGAWKNGRWHGPKWWRKRAERQQRFFDNKDRLKEHEGERNPTEKEKAELGLET